MNDELLNRLKEITPEEKSLLDGRHEIDRTIYTDADSERIDAALLLEHGKLISEAHAQLCRNDLHVQR